jgi:hypothetical protein
VLRRQSVAKIPEVLFSLFSDKSDILNDSWSRVFQQILLTACEYPSITVGPLDEWKLMCFEFLRLG